jgi:REP element-mobilizing transposase RayT
MWEVTGGIIMEKDLPRRKPNRIPDYDYSQYGYYFITVCSNNHKKIFGEIKDSRMILNDYGVKVERILNDVVLKMGNMLLDNYVIMPNHVHLIIAINQESKEGIFEVIRDFKSITTLKYIEGVKEGIYEPFDKFIWQRSYFDHVIRNEKSYLEVSEYINNNPLKWALDKYNFDNSQM